MIDPARIKRAARRRWERMNPGIPWDNVREDAKARMEESIAATATDLFPELDGEEPSAWLAPWETTSTLWEAADLNCRADDEFDEMWVALRDAHLREQTT